MNRPLKETKELLKNTIKSHKTIENKKKKGKHTAAVVVVVIVVASIYYCTIC